MKPEEVEAVIDAMTEHSESSLESFFYSYGLADAFNSPGKGWGKRKKVNAALSGAESRGISPAELLAAARDRFLGPPEAESDRRRRSPEALLQELLNETHQLEVADTRTAESLVSRTQMIVRELFGEHSNYAARLNSVTFRESTSRQRLDQVTGTELWNEAQTRLIAILETAAEHVQLFGLPGEAPRILAREERTPEGAPPPAADRRKVFVVHGRNLAVRDAMFAFLRAIDLNPIEFEHARQATGKPSPYVGEVLTAAFSMAQAIVVLITPDDEARLREVFQMDDDPTEETELTPQARPNVLFEAGMAMGLSRSRTVLVQFGKTRQFSDVGGVLVVRFNDNSQNRQVIAQRLQSAGCEVSITGTDWHTAGSFPAKF